MSPPHSVEYIVETPFGRESRWMLPAAWVASVLALIGAASGSGGRIEGFLLLLSQVSDVD